MRTKWKAHKNRGEKKKKNRKRHIEMTISAI